MKRLIELNEDKDTEFDDWYDLINEVALYLDKRAISYKVHTLVSVDLHYSFVFVVEANWYQHSIYVTLFEGLSYILVDEEARDFDHLGADEFLIRDIGPFKKPKDQQGLLKYFYKMLLSDSIEKTDSYYEHHKKK